MIMNYLFLLLSINMPIQTIKIFNFNKNSNIYSWRIVDDNVMGGRSSSNISLNKDGFGVFNGTISLDNNGGFCSVRYVFKALKANNQLLHPLVSHSSNYRISSYSFLN